jgi:ferredoxin-type protein NapF
MGQWIALLTFGGACLGYPLLLWLDPMAMFSGFFGVFQTATMLSAVGLPIVLLVSLIWPKVWCAKLCPLGAAQDFLALPRRLLRRTRRDPQNGDGQPIARRSLLAMGLGAAWAAVTLRFSRAEAARPLRPPGAIAEGRFGGVCARCGNCVRACPSKIIRPDLGQGGVAGFLAPVLDFEKGYCLETCARCTEVCPSGAITRLSPEQKRGTRIGLAQVNMEYCLIGEEKECSICVNRCPYGAITIAFDRQSYTNIPRIARDKCPGCGACEAACPTTPKAISIRALGGIAG